MHFYVCQSLLYFKNNDSRTSMSNAQPMVTRIIKKLLQIKKKNVFCTISILEKYIFLIYTLCIMYTCMYFSSNNCYTFK